jgi:MFS family permease
MQIQFGPLWRNADFMKYWLGETISLLGSQVTVLALPFTAVITLRATPLQLGILGAANFMPFFLLTLFAGVWIDRQRRKPLLITANIARAALLGCIPLLVLFNQLRLDYLYVIAFLTGGLNVFFEIACQSFLPSLVSREQLTEANVKLSFSESFAQIGGSGLGGILVQLLTAPLAITFDAFSFLVSGLAIALTHTQESLPTPLQQSENLWQQIGVGVSFIFNNRYLRPLMLQATVYNLFSMLIETLSILFALQELKMSPAVLGLTIAIGSIGSLLGSLLADRLAKRYAIGATIIGSLFLSCIAPIMIPVASGPVSGAILLSGASLLGGAGQAIANVHLVTLRQVITPDKLMGRLHASNRFFTWGVVPVGSLLGGFLGTTVGLRMALFIGAFGLLFAFITVFFSPILRLQHLSDVE